MSISMTVIGFRPPDKKWTDMKKIWDSCKAADVEIPEVVEKFFNWIPPDEAGVELNLEHSDCVKEWRTDYANGFELEVAKLPKDVKIIRFYYSR